MPYKVKTEEETFLLYRIRPLIEKYQPDLWVYGHTHEFAVQEIGKTRIFSNQLGYPRGSGRYGCDGNFDKGGCVVEL